MDWAAYKHAMHLLTAGDGTVGAKTASVSSNGLPTGVAAACVVTRTLTRGQANGDAGTSACCCCCCCGGQKGFSTGVQGGTAGHTMSPKGSVE